MLRPSVSLAASHGADDTVSVVHGKFVLRIRILCGCGISVASLLCCSPQLCVAPIGNFISFHFSFNHVRFVCCFAFPKRLFSFFTSDLSQFTMLMGISVPATLQHMIFLKCFFSFCALYKAGFTFDSYFLFARGTGKPGIFLKLLLHNFFSSPSCLLWVAPVLGTAELPDELLCCVSALLWWF